MFEWLKNLIPSAPVDEERQLLDPDATMRTLRMMVTDAIVDELYDSMDFHAETLGPQIRELVEEGNLGEYPLNTATIWLGYREGNAGRELDDFLASHIEDAIVWAFQFEENNVLTGAALGALDGLEPSAREAMAFSIFERLETPRRYWLLLKVRTRPFVEEVVRSLQNYDDSWRRRAAGAFRQFTPDDVPLLFELYDVESPGAELLVEAMGATRDERVRPILEEALEDSRTGVRESAARGLTILDMHAR